MTIHKELKKKAKQIRKNTLSALYHSQSGHPGPSLSIVEIMTSLIFKEMNIGNVYFSNEGELIDPVTNVLFNQRYLDDEKNHDILILSKGHAAATLYAALAVAGFIQEEELKTLRIAGSRLQGHLVRGTLPLVAASTGSLGQGLSIGIGRALGSRLKKDGRRFFVIIGDGESQEGQVWEAIMSASKFKLSNLVAIVDYNKFQNDGALKDTMPLGLLVDKWESFGWYTQEIDGHDFEELLKAYKNVRKENNRPSCIIAHTIKGKGVSFMEDTMEWHSRAIKPNEYEKAMNEL